MKKKEIFNKLQVIISNRLRCNESEITLKADLSKDLSFDWIDKIEVITDIKAEFNISISDEQGEEVETVQQVVDLISELINN